MSSGLLLQEDLGWIKRRLARNWHVCADFTMLRTVCDRTRLASTAEIRYAKVLMRQLYGYERTHRITQRIVTEADLNDVSLREFQNRVKIEFNAEIDSQFPERPNNLG
ncbi:hypothetical protein VN97_g7597 [Penicillium thymicola]|uniref:Uncharacterized protein n=1 Tax=Penicillium thymicola TaxID=293382 RepID=A0AAI9TEV6_PENTH|nr:hypothetical protein VN97_g7597 [Penicillium thymicola]